MPRRILVLVGHPDPAPERFCRALAEAYADGAIGAGHEVRRLDLGRLDITPLRSREDWLHGDAPPDVAQVQAGIEWCEHLVLLYPLWLGDVPAALKALLEQTLRPGFAFEYAGKAEGRPRLKGRSARIVVTMGMPGVVYRAWFGAHSLRSLRRNILHFVGIRPVRSTVVGMVEGDAARRAGWLEKLRKLGAAAG